MTKISNSTLSSLQINSLSYSLFMPPYSVLHYQYYYGTPFMKSIKNMYNQGGFLRFYKGFSHMFLYVLTLKTGEVFLHEYVSEKFKNLDDLKKNTIGSLLCTSWKMLLYPINTISVKKQLYSKIDYSSLNFKNLYAGCMYNIPSIFLSNFLWFGSMRIYPYYVEKLNLFKNKKYDIVGGISGTLASITTDLFVNPIKVLKINKQGNNKKNLKKNISNLYRGLSTRIIITSIHGFIFGLFWKRNI